MSKAVRNEGDEAYIGILFHLLENEAGADKAAAPSDEYGVSHGTAPRL